MKTFKDNLYNILIKQKIDNYKELENTKNNYATFSAEFQFFLIILKCLNYNNSSGLKLNRERLEDELKLWKYYSNGFNNSSTMHFFGIISLAIANFQLEDLNQSIKEYVEYFSIESGLIPEFFYLAYIIRETIHGENIDEITDNAKKNIIEFSYIEIFEIDDKSKIISFEKSRIKLISDLYTKKYIDYQLISFFITNILLNFSEINNSDNALFNLVENSYNYLFGLRKGQIKTLTYKKNGEKLFNKVVGDIIMHENFSKSEIIKLVNNGNKKIVIVNSKFGCIRLVN